MSLCAIYFIYNRRKVVTLRAVGNLADLNKKHGGKMRKLSAFVGLALSMVLAGAVQAQDGSAPSDPATTGTDPALAPAASDTMVAPGGATTGVSQSLVARGVQGAAGSLTIHTLVGINMSKGAVAKPFSIAPDIFYAVSDQLQLGLVHNGPLGWQTQPGTGLCLSGKENGCPKVWNNVGFDALFSLMKGSTDLSAHGTVYLAPVDPLFVQVALGVAGKLHINETMALFFDPSILVGVTKRDQGNKERIYLPVEFQFQLQPQLALVAMTALYGSLDGFGDSYVIPFGLGAFYNVNEMIDVGGRFSFDNLLGNNSSADVRSLSLLVNVRL